VIIARPFVGLDTSKLRNAVAIAGRLAGVARFGSLGEDREQRRPQPAKLVRKLFPARYERGLDVLLRAGPTRLRTAPADQEPSASNCVGGGRPRLDFQSEPGDKVEDQPGAMGTQPGKSCLRCRRTHPGLGCRTEVTRRWRDHDAGAARRRRCWILRTKRASHVLGPFCCCALGRPYPESRKTWTQGAC